MDACLKAPFFAPEERLPAPLPTREAIISAEVVLEEYTGRRVVQLGTSYIVKYGSNVTLTEGENLLFLKETRTIRVPEVFALYSEDHAASGRKVNYIIMECISGSSLDKCWDKLASADREIIVKEVRAYIDALRNIPAPGYFGCVSRQPFEESIFWTPSGSGADQQQEISGPFQTETEFNAGLLHKYRYNNGSPHKAKFFARWLPAVFRDHKPVFCHADLQRKNIIWREDKSVVIIDWESAGWYPEYWEYALATFCCSGWRDDWHEYLSRMIREYPNEYVWFDMLVRELWS